MTSPSNRRSCQPLPIWLGSTPRLNSLKGRVIITKGNKHWCQFKFQFFLIHLENAKTSPWFSYSFSPSLYSWQLMQLIIRLANESPSNYQVVNHPLPMVFLQFHHLLGTRLSGGGHETGGGRGSGSGLLTGFPVQYKAQVMSAKAE